jgi:hypothetical protein
LPERGLSERSAVEGLRGALRRFVGWKLSRECAGPVSRRPGGDRRGGCRSWSSRPCTVAKRGSLFASSGTRKPGDAAFAEPAPCATGGYPQAWG